MTQDEQEKNKKINAIDELVKRIGTYRTGPELAELLQFIKKLPHISPYNMMLIHIQKPGSEFVARADDWKRLYERDIKPGARPGWSASDSASTIHPTSIWPAT